MRVFDDYLKSVFENKKVLVLGSAPNVTMLNATFMETFDIIVRVNNYRIFNQCRRVDVFASFFGKSIRKSIGDLKRDGCKLLMCKCPQGAIEIKNEDGSINTNLSHDFDWIYDFRDDWFKEADLPFYISTVENFNENNLLIGQVCTTGTAAILDVLRYNPKILYFGGFDFAMSGIHNIRQRMIFKPYPNVHHFEEEFHLMKKLVAEKANLDCMDEIKKLFKNDYKRPSSWTK